MTLSEFKARSPKSYAADSYRLANFFRPDRGATLTAVDEALKAFHCATSTSSSVQTVRSATSHLHGALTQYIAKKTAENLAHEATRRAAAVMLRGQVQNVLDEMATWSGQDVGPMTGVFYNPSPPIPAAEVATYGCGRRYSGGIFELPSGL